MLDFGMGDLREPTEPFIREALVAGLRGDGMGYPAAVGRLELREAIGQGPLPLRHGARPGETEVIPTSAARRAIFTFAPAIVDTDGTRDMAAFTDPGYPVYERGALLAHAPLLPLPLREERVFPDLDAIDDEIVRRPAVFWVNYPNNPRRDCRSPSTSTWPGWRANTGSPSPPTRRTPSSGSTSRRPPRLQLADRTNVVVFNTFFQQAELDDATGAASPPATRR